MPSDDDTSTNPWRAVFHPTTFLLAGAVLLVVGIGLPLLTQVVGRGDGRLNDWHTTLYLLNQKTTWPCGCLFLAAAYLWVHRDK